MRKKEAVVRDEPEICQEERILLDEKKLAQLVGTRRRFLARWRQTYGARNEDWTTVEARVALTVDGARKACMALNLPFKSPAAITGDRFENKKTGAVSVRVKRTVVNERMLLCLRIDDGTAVSVRVRSNLAFRPGDEFEAVDDGAGVLTHYGEWPEMGW